MNRKIVKILISNQMENALLTLDKNKVVTFNNPNSKFSYETSNEDYDVIFRTIAMKFKYILSQMELFSEDSFSGYQINLIYDDGTSLKNDIWYLKEDLLDVFNDVNKLLPPLEQALL